MQKTKIATLYLNSNARVTFNKRLSDVSKDAEVSHFHPVYIAL